MKLLSTLTTLLLCFNLYALDWSYPIDLSSDATNSEEPQIAVDRNGDAVAVWESFNGTHKIIQSASYTRAKQAWTLLDELSSERDNAQNAQVATNQNGDTIAVWEVLGNNKIIQASIYNKTANSWSRPVNISEIHENASSAQIAVDESGDAIAVWERSNDKVLEIQAAAYHKATNTWSLPNDLSRSNLSASNPQLVINGNGDGVVAWVNSGKNLNNIQATSYTKSIGTWSLPLVISNIKDSAQSPKIAVDSNGNVVAVWESDQQKIQMVMGATFAKMNGQWSAPTEISELGSSAYSPQVVIDSDGDALAIWRADINNSSIIRIARFHQSKGSWTLPQDISTEQAGSFAPNIGIDKEGNAVAVWESNNGNYNVIQAVDYIKALNQWSLPSDLSLDGEHAHLPQVGVNNNGERVVVWTQIKKSNNVIQASTSQVPNEHP